MYLAISKHILFLQYLSKIDLNVYRSYTNDWIQSTAACATVCPVLHPVSTTIAQWEHTEIGCPVSDVAARAVQGCPVGCCCYHR